MTSLLVLTNDRERLEEFEGEFENADFHSLADVSVNSGMEPRVMVQETDISEYNSVFLDPEPKAAIFSRVFLEGLQDESINCNIEPNTFFILSKKHYLFKVLKEKDVPIPDTAAVSGQKGLTNIEQDLDFPVVGKMYEEFERKDIKRIQNLEELKRFAERSEYGKNYVVIQEYVEGEIFDVLYIDGEIVSLKVEGDRWDENELSRTYHSLSSDQKEVVKKTAESIGTKFCRIRLAEDKVVQVKTRLGLDEFKKVSGKNVFGKVSRVLKGDED